MEQDNHKHPPPLEADEVLIARSQAGEHDAFGDLYIRYIDKIYRYIYYRISNRDDAEDLTEAVFIKAWRGIGSYKSVGVPFLAWLYRIARNVVIDYRRSNKVEFVDIEAQYDLPDGTDDPELAVLKNMTLNEVLSAIERLEPAQREVITLRFFQGLSHKETAEVMERKTGAVRVLQYRALLSLRSKLTLEDAQK